MNDRMIFDIGMNNGDDTDFYLKKGFNVVAVDANPELCAGVRERFAGEIAARRLAVIHGAIAASAGEVELYLNEDVSGWSSVSPAWIASRALSKSRVRAVRVPAVALVQIIAEHGVPYYLKVDIQGAELVCLEALLGLTERPTYLSVSAGTDVLPNRSFEHARAQIELLSRLGYDRFQIVAQEGTSKQRCPRPPREGVYVDHTFPHGSSGLFGRELPAMWVSARAALQEHRRICRSYRFAGHSRSPAGWFQRLPSERIKYGLDRLFSRGLGWYDTHAMRSAATSP
jgi:FkbM family methyltransferase